MMPVTHEAGNWEVSSCIIIRTLRPLPLSVVTASGPITARDRHGVVVVPAPLDYVAWTARVAALARHPDLKAQQRGVWLTGQLSPRARQELTTRGWTVHEGVQRPAPQSAAR